MRLLDLSRTHGKSLMSFWMTSAWADVRFITGRLGYLRKNLDIGTRILDFRLYAASGCILCFGIVLHGHWSVSYMGRCWNQSLFLSYLQHPISKIPHQAFIRLVRLPNFQVLSDSLVLFRLIIVIIIICALIARKVDKCSNGSTIRCFSKQYLGITYITSASRWSPL